MDILRFGTAGIPTCTKGDTLQGIQDVRKLGLDSFELEFVHSINISKEKAPDVKKTAQANDVVITCHAPYFINLNTDDKKKYHASVGRIVNSARIASLCGGWSVCFHAGYYMKDDKKKVYDKIETALKEISKTLKDEGNKIWIRPEISGKQSQFGDLDELIQLSKNVERVFPCVDFSHLFARSIGKNNTYNEFKEILTKMEKELGKKALDEMHIHAAGIAFGDKGEKNHLLLKDSKFNYTDLLKVLKEFNVKGVVTCESPNIEEDALLMKKYYYSVR